MRGSFHTPSRDQGTQPKWTDLDFGKYIGKSLPQVMFTNPDWVFWAMEHNAFKRSPSLLSQAKDLAHKATRIRVPQSGTETLVVEHFINRPTMKYSHFWLVPKSQPVHPGSSPSYRQDVIDLSFPRRIAPNDRKGNKRIVMSLKEIYFGSKSARLNRDRCEAFFSSPDNFG